MVQLPFRREELFYYLRLLANAEQTRDVWVNHHFPPGVVYDEFDYAVHLLFDDTALADAPEKTIGWILENADEIPAVSRVIKAIDDLLNQYGTELTDEQYINKPEWANVVTAAAAALRVLEKNPAEK